MMNKVLIGLLGAGVIATGGYAAASGVDDSAPARTVSLPGATTADTTTTGTTTTGTTTTGTTTSDDTTTSAATTDDILVGDAPAPTVTGSEDISGPCDEAEHANDPRCTGGAGADDRSDDDGADDRSGSSDDSDDRDDDDDESDDSDDDDRSGSNSGKG